MPDSDHPATTDRRPPIPREIRVLIGSAFLVALGFGLVTPVLPQFAQSFDVGATAAAVVVSAFAFFRLVFAPAGGQLVARLGERPVYLTGLLIVAVSTAATGFAQAYWQLLVFRGLGGIGSTMFTVSALAFLVRLAPEEIRGRVSAMWASMFLIGGVLGPAVGGLLGGFGLRVPFLVYAAFLLAASLVVFWLIPGQAHDAQEQRNERPPFSVREAWHDSAYRASLASAFANGWTNFGVRNAILPLFAVALVADATWVAGAAIAVFALGNAAGLSLAGRRTDRVGRRPFIIGGLVVSGVFTAATGWSTETWLLFAVCVGAGLGAGMLNPSQQATVADVIGRERSGGPALSAFQMCQDAGAIVGPIAAGLLVDHAGYPMAFLASGAIALVAVLPWLAARETLRSRPVSG